MLSMILVDDEEIIREGLRDCVDWASMGITISGEASNGKEALVKIKESRPDILLTDVVMPGMNGIELIQAVREEELPVAIIVLSAFENFHYIQSALRHDAADYLVKPFNEAELSLVMNKVVQQVKRNKVISEYVPGHALLSEAGSRDHRISQDIAKLIEKRYAEKLTVQDIASEISLSINHMMNLFKKETGETVGDYLTKVRMRHAKRLLLDPMIKIYEIAGEIGYSDPNYFAKAFKKHTGLSPKEFRDGRL